MAMRVILSLGLFLALLFAGSTRAGEPGANAAGSGQQRGSTAVERRIAALESRIEELLKEVRGLRAQLGERPVSPAEKPDIRMFSLRYADSRTLVTLLGKLFTGPDRARVAADAATNTLIVSGTAERIAAIEGLVEYLDQPARDQPGGK